jgi:hypothetical protein
MIYFRTRFLICGVKKRFITPLMGSGISDFHLFPILFHSIPAHWSEDGLAISMFASWHGEGVRVKVVTGEELFIIGECKDFHTSPKVQASPFTASR